MTEHATRRRLTVQEAAEVLGTSVDAVRMRVRRGSLESEKVADGRVHVYLNDDSSETKHRPNGESLALISAKDETIAVLREQIAEEREARRRADTIIAQLTHANAAHASRVPELEAPREQADVSETVEEAPEGAESPGPLREELRRVHRGRGGGGCSGSTREEHSVRKRKTRTGRPAAEWTVQGGACSSR